MKRIIEKRIVPISAITIAAFATLAAFQLFVIAGGLETRASLVKRVAPWAYEPFMKLVGEHPDTRPEWSKAGRHAEETKSSSALAEVAGLDADAPLIQGNPLIEPTTPVEEPVAVIPVSTPTNEPAVDEDVPVG